MICSLLVCGDSHTAVPFCQMSMSEQPWFNCNDFHFKPMITTYSTVLNTLRTKHWTSDKLSSTLLAHIRPYCLAWPWLSCSLHLAQVSAQHSMSHFDTPEHQCSALCHSSSPGCQPVGQDVLVFSIPPLQHPSVLRWFPSDERSACSQSCSSMILPPTSTYRSDFFFILRIP